ncbi:MAG: hypothetical protein M8866_09560 [marine benthic group bacterium]|nr:hypothetical protein [Candidatus Benthicola marisminoris]
MAVLAVCACADSATEPPPPAATDLLVLNSTGQTLAGFSVGEGLSESGAPVDLGAGFDGSAFDASNAHVVTTVSSFGGSRVVFVDLESRDVLTSSFPEPESDLANPSAASFDGSGTAWVGGRGSDAIYRVRPGDLQAERIAGSVGSFIERVVPIGERLYAVDANIDDEGGTYAPLGPGRVVVLSRSGEEERVIDLPPAVFNPTDAVAAGGRLIVLAAGSLDPETFMPVGDGALVVLDSETGATISSQSLAANGVELELGRDGLVYLTTTVDFSALSVLVFDPAAGAFVRGPGDPVLVRGADGARVDCWVATGLADGRIVCATFSFAEAGRLVLFGSDGQFIDEVPSGFGSTDVVLR